MEYPGTKLTKSIRHFIFLFFVGLFLIISPIIILYTSGYRYDFKNGFLKETGSINVDVLPDTAEVYLNNAKLKSGIPVRLNDLAPGKYIVTIKNNGYFDWQKNIEIKNKETVYVKDVVLLKKNEPTLIHDGVIQETTISSDGQFLIYSVIQNKNKEIWQKNLKSNELLMVEGVFSAADTLKITFMQNGLYYAISTEQPPYKKIVLINAQKPEKKMDLATYSKLPIIKYQWKESSTPEIYFSNAQQIMTFFPENENLIFISKNIFADWYMENGQLWILDDNTTTKKAVLTRDALGFKNVFFTDFETTAESLEIFVAQKDFVLIKKRNQPEMVLLANDKKYNIAGEKFIISKYNDWLIAWTPWEIWTRAQNEDPVLLNRSGLQLQQVVSLDKYNTLGLIWAENTTALFPYYLVSHNLLPQKINVAVSDSDNRTLYFGGKYNDKEGLWKLEY
jgi:hypothetical protein